MEKICSELNSLKKSIEQNEVEKREVYPKLRSIIGERSNVINAQIIEKFGMSIGGMLMEINSYPNNYDFKIYQKLTDAIGEYNKLINDKAHQIIIEIIKLI